MIATLPCVQSHSCIDSIYIDILYPLQYMSQHFLLLEVINTHDHKDEAVQNMAELAMLVDTYGGKILAQSIQHKIHPDPNTYIGAGKVEWLKAQVAELEIDVVVLNDIVKAGQIFRLEKELWSVNPRIRVWDRVDLILNIFDQHATSREAKLQIKLAMIDHLGPRAYGLGGALLSRQAAGVGTRGKGETNIEIERRRSRRERQRLVAELAKVTGQQREQMRQRKAKGVFTIALVGYTSAGKTSLFNTLTKKSKVAHHSLFTTLDSVTGRINPRNGKHPIIISDTIGFIKDLPPELIQTFRSTLAESIEAHVLLEVLDIADKQYLQKHQVVLDILKSLDTQGTVITVANKIDLLDASALQQRMRSWNGPEPLLISTKTGEGIGALRDRISTELDATFART